MNSAHKYFNTAKSNLILVLILTLNGYSFYASASDMTDGTNTSSNFEINATIMEIDWEKGSMVVAEKIISLPHITQNGNKEWLTETVDTAGQAISITSLKRRDRIIVNGKESESVGMKAEKITLVATEKNGTRSNSTLPSRIYHENGVWKN